MSVGRSVFEYLLVRSDRQTLILMLFFYIYNNREAGRQAGIYLVQGVLLPTLLNLQSLHVQAKCIARYLILSHLILSHLILSTLPYLPSLHLYIEEEEEKEEEKGGGDKGGEGTRV